MKTSHLAFLACLSFGLLFLTGCPKPDWPKCENDDQCKENDEGQEMNYICVKGACRECGGDADCGEGFVCRENACVPKPECERDRDCTGNLVCRLEQCVLECGADGDCGDAMKCEGQRCVPDIECSSDADCAEGEECSGGQCLAAEALECSIDTVYFEFDSHSLTRETKSVLDANAECLRQKGASARLDGHCDERGTEEYNLALGEKRANSVKKYLRNLGVSRLKVRSYGEERPANHSSTESGWAENRRVEFAVSEAGL